PALTGETPENHQRLSARHRPAQLSDETRLNFESSRRGRGDQVDVRASSNAMAPCIGTT
ncbi:MAG: hypothetical protein QOD87_1537, partial [Pseudonocardiales bacterium]|nr:hypothetical protein [Pseudonocardiales bacterium]